MSLEWEIRALESGREFTRCAQLMTETDPWKCLQWSRQQCESNLTHSQLRVDGAFSEEGVLLGFLASMAHGIGLEPLIEYLCVDAEVRNRGVGSALVEFFELALHPQARNLYLFVSDINPNAQRLYLRLGYLPVGALPNYNLEQQTEFLFRKTRGPLR
jgi:ribosomal protein S18 acetylase RimI-like enzyme